MGSLYIAKSQQPSIISLNNLGGYIIVENTKRIDPVMLSLNEFLLISSCNVCDGHPTAETCRAFSLTLSDLLFHGKKCNPKLNPCVS